MEKPVKFALPPPNFTKNVKDAFKPKPHYLTPSGMSLLPREKQPPPMYGKHGATLPARYLKHHAEQTQQNSLAANVPEKHYCEPCEIELHSVDDLKRHRAQHEKCPVAGCVFKGHPSVMDKHVNSLHASGLFDNFKKLSTPEEIAAWRDERRKRYPTLANVLLKQKAKEQRQKRGERLDESKNRFGKVNDRKRAQPNILENNGSLDVKKPREENKKFSKLNNKRRNKNKSKNSVIKPKVQATEKSENVVPEDDILSCVGIAMFRGTSQLKDYKHFNEKKKVDATNALFGLVGMYGTDDDESVDNESSNEDEAEHIATVNVIKNNDSQNNNELAEKCCQNQDIVHKEVESSSDVISKSCESDKKHFQAMEDTAKDECEVSTIVVNTVEKTSSTAGNELFKHKDKSSDDEAPEETPIQRIMDDFPLQAEKGVLNNESSKCIGIKKKKLVTTKQNKKYGLNYRKSRLRNQNTLLEKLLESDIRHERNVLLQCVRFVCENNFFNIGNNKKESSDKTIL